MSPRIDAVPAATGRDWLTIASLAALVAAFGVVAGPLGLLAGIATAAVGYLLGPPYALAFGHVALVAVVPNGIEPLSVVPLEAAFVAVLLAPVRRTASPVRIALVAVASAIALAGTAWVVVDSQSVGLAAATVLALVAFIAYGLHRYELVRLGLVPTDDDGTSPPTGSNATADSPPESSTEPPAEPTADSPTDT